MTRSLFDVGVGGEFDSGGQSWRSVPRVAAEVGWSFLLIEGTCQYWSMTEPDGPILRGSLDASEEAAFVVELELGRWNSGSSATGGCADAGVTHLKFLEDEISVSCTSTAVTQAHARWLETLHARGRQTLGEVRYSVVDASNDGWVVGNTTNIASPWPLATDPAELAVDPSEEDSAEPQVVRDDEANALRGARDAYAARGSSVGPWLRIPVVVESAGAEPRYFNLAMRDTTPFEQYGRLALDAYL